MKKKFSLFLLVSSCIVSGQVGINTINPQGTFNIDGGKDNPTIGMPSVAQQANDVVVTPEGNIGIGVTNPTAKLEITSGTNGISGLKFNNINSSTLPNSNIASLGIDSNGNVGVQSTAPILTAFKSFSIDQNVASNSLITIGTLEFRYANTNCSGANSYMQIRSTSGSNNIGMIHGAYLSAQNTTGFVNTLPTTISPTFMDITMAPMNCIQDGHAQFSFFSYVDRTYYRVNVHIADGDSLGFGALGYIFVEFQK
ncbi:hypothetical protein [Chryseobacterium potabilaquae]|nr:hypothetical protein [Chryseobacterium potabilaquae]